MKQLFPVIVLCIFLVSTTRAQQNCSGNSCMPDKVREDCTVKAANGCIDWSNGVIYATGMGVPNLTLKSPAQRSYSAHRAAQITAMRNLLQMVEGVNITSASTVKMGMLEDDTILSQVKGRLQHVQEVGKPAYKNDGSVVVTMKMYMRDIISILINNNHFRFQDTSRKPQGQDSVKQGTKGSDKPEYGGSTDVIYTGLIIDARGSGVEPAMSPKIYDKNGKEVYGSAAVERDFVLQHGIVGYVKDLKNAEEHERVKGNPLLIKAELNPGKSTDLVISDEDTKMLIELDSKQTFLREARVLIIIG